MSFFGFSILDLKKMIHFTSLHFTSLHFTSLSLASALPFIAGGYGAVGM
jgi:hypothetical protein